MYNKTMKPKLTIGHFPIIDHLVLGVAKANDGGHFANFELQTKNYVNWDVMAKDMMNKKLDGMFILSPFALDLFHKGAGAKIVLLGQREGQAIVASKNIRDIRGLRGKKVLVPHKFSVHNILFYKTLKHAGLDPARDVSYETGFKDVRDIPGMLEGGQVDAFVSAEPWNTIAVKRGFGHIIEFSQDLMAHHVCCVLVMRDEITEKLPEAAQEFIDALVRAGMFVNAYPRQAAEIAEKFIGCPRAIALTALTRSHGSVMFWDLLPRLEDFEELQDIAVDEMKLWSSKLKVEKFIDASFAQKAYRKWTINVRQEIKDRGRDRSLPGNFADAASRTRAFFKEPIIIVGAKNIYPGEKYPKNIMHNSRVVLSLNILEKVSRSGPIFVSSEVSGSKGSVLFSENEQIEPEFVFAGLRDSQIEKVLEALHFGEKMGPTKIFKADEIGMKAFGPQKIKIFKEERKEWLVLNKEVFLFLPLLLASFSEFKN
jgi:NitT/TauT family transport system substrate-binding protein